MYSCDGKAEFSAVFGVTWSFRNQTKGQSLNASVLIKSYSNISQFLFHQVIQVWIRILKFEWTNIQNIQKPSFAALSAVAQQTLK